MTLAQQRQQAHAYLNQLPPAQVSAIRSLLESMIHPLGTAIQRETSKGQDLSQEEEESVAGSLHWLIEGRDIPLEVVLADYGMTLEDFERLTKRAAKSKTAGHE